MRLAQPTSRWYSIKKYRGLLVQLPILLLVNIIIGNRWQIILLARVNNERAI